MIIRAKHIILRPLIEADAQWILEHENKAEVVAVSGHNGGFELGDIQAFIKTSQGLQADKQARWMVTLDEVLIGTIDLFDLDESNGQVGIGIYIAAGYRGKGHGLQSLVSLMSHCREKYGIQRFLADVHADNLQSIKLFHSAGFKSLSEKEGLVHMQLQYS